MQEKFIKFITDNRLAEKGDRILLGVSGGVDSMVMAHLFIACGYNTGIAHCNFRLRGANSDADEKLVREFASANNIPFHNICFETKEYASEKKITLQMAARDLRHSWFEETMVKYGYNLLALAHNKSDRTETIILNLIRGTGITGMAAMKPRSGHRIRPLLFASRNEILGYAGQNGIPWREDESNKSVKYTRNKIRHEILPPVREINPSFDDTIQVTADRFAGYDEIISQYLAGVKEKSVRKVGNEYHFDIRSLISFSPLKTILFELFTPFGITSSGTGELAALLSSEPGKKILTRTHIIYRDREVLIVKPLTTGEYLDIVIDTPEELNKLDFVMKAEIAEIRQPYKPAGDRYHITLDAGLVSFPLIIRKWRHGDRFIPLGMNNFRKLSDYFTDRKFSVPQKETAKIMESGGNIVAILGERIDNRYRVTKDTRKILKIILREPPAAL
ncbi:MAG: tRNA lysidine(34) synthetase TilS [Bacteroidales bacterium]|nr:tRNA lysidine(34) synthetase TilS [Bacteroidales bacterium]